jgi:hypothetical protein
MEVIGLYARVKLHSEKSLMVFIDYDSGLASEPILSIGVLDITYQPQTPVPNFCD